MHFCFKNFKRLLIKLNISISIFEIYKMIFKYDTIRNLKCWSIGNNFAVVIYSTIVSCESSKVKASEVKSKLFIFRQISSPTNLLRRIVLLYQASIYSSTALTAEKILLTQTGK